MVDGRLLNMISIKDTKVRFKKWILVDSQINYNRLIEVICGQLGINQSCNDVQVFSQNVSTLNEMSYQIQDDYDVTVLIRLAKG